MKAPLSHRRKKSKWILSTEVDIPKHSYKEVSRTTRRFTVDVVDKCVLCGCERHRTMLGSNTLRVHYFRSDMSYQHSPACWGAKNPV